MLHELHKSNIHTEMVTGDRLAIATRTAQGLPLDKVHAELDPEAKFQLVRDLTRQGRKILMVGDGINDTAALRAAHVSLAPASAIDAARVAADIVLLRPELDALPEVLALSRQARRRINENFAISALYNLIAVPIALAGAVTPLIAALAMSSSSIAVSLNAVRGQR